MNKLNQLGCELIEYKQELNKDYSDVIIKSLMFTIDKLIEDDIIDVDVHYAIKEKDIKEEQLREILLNKEAYLKTEEELLKEYAVITKRIEEILELEEYEDTTISITNEVKLDKIQIMKEFILTEEFIKNYFYIESESDYKALMNRKGFIEKFAILRLEKILRDFKEGNLEENNDKLFLGYEMIYSNVFYDSDREVYGIHLLFDIDVNDLEPDEQFITIIENIKDVITKATGYFNSRMKI